MNTEKVFFITRLALTFVAIIMACACSKKMDNGTTAQPAPADMLVQSGEWFTTGATLVAADSTAVTLAANDPFLKTILLDNVTFYANGTAIDTNNPNGLTSNGLNWTLQNSHLVVHPNFNNTDKVDAIITYLSYYKLVMNVSDFYVYNGVTYIKMIQTLTH